MKKHLKLLVTETDLFNIFIVLLALVLSFLGSWTIVDGKTNLNSQFPIFLYVTLATLISSILDPILEIVRVESKKKKLITITFSTIISILIFLWSLLDNSILVKLQSISSRGGISAISAALLLLNLAYINYQIQVSKEREIKKNKKETLESKKELLKLAKRVLELEKEKNGKN